MQIKTDAGFINVTSMEQDVRARRENNYEPVTGRPILIEWEEYKAKIRTQDAYLVPPGTQMTATVAFGGVEVDGILFYVAETPTEKELWFSSISKLRAVPSEWPSSVRL